MATFYGQVEGCARTIASRRGHSSIRSSVQSYDGSLIMELRYNKNDELCLTVEYAKGTEFKGDMLYSGTLNDFIKLLTKYKYNTVWRICHV